MRGTNFLLATMALSALVLIGITSTAGSTTATFTAVTVNPGNTFATATLMISNDKPNAGDLVNITNLVPGDTNGTCDAFVRDRDADERDELDLEQQNEEREGE